MRWGFHPKFLSLLYHQREIVGEASCRLRQFFALLFLRDPDLPDTFMKLEIRIKEKSKDAYVTIRFYRLRVVEGQDSLTIKFVRHLH